MDETMRPHSTTMDLGCAATTSAGMLIDDGAIAMDENVVGGIAGGRGCARCC
jgi:hypothetical protein